ncbi:hypothetical protein, partial [Ciceribacter sp. RN22]|uniref:hypothetical protein n=1 Tax=Ciceribacter sp. RN22 TaxID=2954932 RepID=UPI00209227E8
ADPGEKHGLAKDTTSGRVKRKKALDLKPPNRETMIRAPNSFDYGQIKQVFPHLFDRLPQSYLQNDRCQSESLQ